MIGITWGIARGWIICTTFAREGLSWAVHSIEAKSILQKSGLPGTRYVINPYTGCVHGCVYCYARFMKRFTAHPEPWGTFLDVKAGAAQILEKQLASRRKPLREEVFFCSVTDPYQPPERQYRQTREILEVLLNYEVPVSILTKSDLVLRDEDLLRKMPGVSVGLSFRRRTMRSPGGSSRARPRPLGDPRPPGTAAGGIETWAFLSPFLPGVSDLEAEAAALAGGADEFGVEAINPQGGNWTGVEKALAEIDPALPGRCKTLSQDAAFWKDLEHRARRLAKEHGMKLTGFYRH